MLEASLRRGCVSAAFAVTLALAPGVRALDADDARADAAREVQSVRAALSKLPPRLAAQRSALRSSEEMIAAGDLALRAKDYERALDVFNQVVELHRQGKTSPHAHAEGLFLLAESYFESGQLLAARRHYAELLDRAVQSPYDSYAGRVLGRLVDVAVQTGTVDALAATAASVAQIANADATGSLGYARGKLSFALGRFDDALAIFAAVPAASEWYPQSRYAIGTVLLQRALAEAGGGGSAEAGARLVVPGASERLRPALAQFHQVTELPRDSAAHGHVIDLAWLAIGRLSYETENYVDAAQAYVQVKRQSPVYYEMLYELAWVYVRVGDYERAERALELLSVAAPDTLDIADSALLRADLMLRSGRFERALAGYEEVRGRFEPARERVDEFIAMNADPAAYYDKLVEEGLSIGGAAALPEVVLDWVREEARGERVFAMIDDVTQAHDLQRRARRLSSKLQAVLGAPSRARAFPELKGLLEKTLGLCNQLTEARRLIALGLEDVSDSDFSGELAEARRARRKLMERAGAMPVTVADFERRQEQGDRAWNRLSQSLSRTTLETDNLQAVINGLRRLLDEADKHGVTRDKASRARFRAQVEQSERQLGAYRARIEAYRLELENGRVQVGLGDRRYAEDRDARSAFRQALREELSLIGGGRGDGDSLDYARSVAPLLADIAALERHTEQIIGAVETEVSFGADELRRLVRSETELLEEYGQSLVALDEEARRLVGEVAMKNFASVRDRLKTIVLRADVGIVQQAWELREEQQERLRGLQRQRASEEKNLRDELREVSDDAGEGP